MKPFNLTLFLLTGFLAGCPQEKDSDELIQALSQRESAIVKISAYTALGNLPALETELNAALDNGMSVNEIKEILIQMYAYCGFPRSLQGINTFMSVVETRRTLFKIKKFKLRQQEKIGIQPPADKNDGAVNRCRSGQNRKKNAGGKGRFRPPFKNPSDFSDDSLAVKTEMNAAQNEEPRCRHQMNFSADSRSGNLEKRPHIAGDHQRRSGGQNNAKPKQ